jgi:hypothetical protein
MTDFQIRSDNVDVEQIMRQIRARIREKRGVDYTEEEIQELARVKLEKFLDPSGVRSDLLTQFRTRNAEGTARNYKFEDTTLFESSRGWLRFLRTLLRPILKLFFNPNPLIDALHIQAELNTTTAKREDLQYELIHNLVLETTRLGIQVKNLKMQVESMSSRLDFDERRARALEGVVQYRPGAVAPLQPPPAGGREPRETRDEQERRTRRRRRRGRRPASAREDSSPGYGATRADSERQESGASHGEASAAARTDQSTGFGETSGNAIHEGSIPQIPIRDGGGEGGPVAPKPLGDGGGEGGPVAPKPLGDGGGEGG